MATDSTAAIRAHGSSTSLPPLAARPTLGPSRLASVSFAHLPKPATLPARSAAPRTYSYSAYTPAPRTASCNGSFASVSSSSDPRAADRRLETLVVRAQHVRALLGAGKHQTPALVCHRDVPARARRIADLLAELEDRLQWRLARPLMVTPIRTASSGGSAASQRAAARRAAATQRLAPREERCRVLLADMEGWMLVADGCVTLGIPLVRPRLAAAEALDLLRAVETELKGLVEEIRKVEREEKEAAKTVWGRLRAWTVPLFRWRKGKEAKDSARSETW